MDEESMPPEKPKFQIMGNFSLIHPDDCSDMQPEHQAYALALQPYLQELDTRKLSQLDRPIKDLSRAFDQFAKAEPESWGKYESTIPSSKYLVRPSGSLSSSLFFLLHMPSFKTDNPEYGEVMDTSNGCISMASGNGWDDKTLVFDYLHRRSETSEGLEQFPAEVLKIHEEFSKNILESTEAKVGLVYGRKVQDRLFSLLECTVLPLWEQFGGVLLVLIHESNFSNANPECRFRMALLLPVHPQWLFYEPAKSDTTVLMDKILEASTKMAGREDVWKPNYYEDKLWQKHRPRNFKSPEEWLKKWGSDISLQKDDIDSPIETQPRIGTWDQFFTKQPHSHSALEELLPTSIQDCEKALKSGPEWNTPADMPESVFKWFKGQKKSLFWDTTISQTADILPVYRHLCGDSSLTDENPFLSLKEIVLGLMKAQKGFYDNGRHKTMALSRSPELWHTRFGLQSIPIRCGHCKKPNSNDDYPMWSTRRPGRYITRTKACGSAECRGSRSRRGMPVDPGIPTVFQSVQELSMPAKVFNKKYERCLRKPDDYTEQQRQPMRSWCFRCKDQTRRHDGLRILIDENPRFTLGSKQSFYLERFAECERCKLKRGSGQTRFVPIDGTPSMYLRALQAFDEFYGHYSDTVKSVILDQWPAPSQIPRDETATNKTARVNSRFSANDNAPVRG